VATGYGRRCAADAARFARIDADQTPEQVWVDVLAAVRQRGLLP
jgi:dTMP kinase